ncbi:mitochondrial peroxiredoxin PRX1 [Hypoxylon sp. FL0543]|nr:mitochondrial peroxiredoxin PRX1 [Hypoxylon sp. FL0543]
MAAFFARAAIRAATQNSRLAFPKATSPFSLAFKLRTQRPIPRRSLTTSSIPSEQPRLRFGIEAPNFQAKTTHGDIDFHQWLGGSWAILFSLPADFTPVRTTELGAFARLTPEFERRGVKMIGLSANDLSSHERWIADINEASSTNLQFPVIADTDCRVSFLYDMIDAQDLSNINEKEGIAFTIQSVFIIDPQKKIRLTMMYPGSILYPASTDRNAAEVLRVVDSLQAIDKKGITTPVNWHLPTSVSIEDAQKK